MRFFVADTETTGLSAKTEAMIEVAIIEIDDQFHELAVYHTLLNPGKPIPAGASAVNNIFDDMVADAPNVKDFFSSLDLGDPKDAVLICHNVGFDAGFLNPHWHPKTELCTRDLAKKLVKAKNYKLGTLLEHFGITLEDAHRATTDARGCKDLLKALVDSSGMSLEQVIAKWGYRG